MKIGLVLCFLPGCLAWSLHQDRVLSRLSTAKFSAAVPSMFEASSPPLDQLKIQILQLGAAMDRGQAYNPTSGEYYKEKMEAAKSKILSLLEQYPNQQAKSLQDMEGEWELVLSTVPHGIFRSSPFFLAVQEAFSFAEEKGACDGHLQGTGSRSISTCQVRHLVQRHLGRTRHCYFSSFMNSKLVRGVCPRWAVSHSTLIQHRDTYTASSTRASFP
mmetsp:Transcript_1690/g.4097  ORF Transcript_1690/g.4097 Transcript_1690/m.4097 type:complete len:216 (-) Transcript_1690:385-1032(-)